MTQYLYAHARIKELNENSAILRLLKEIEEVTKNPLEIYIKDNSMVIHYLIDCRIKRPITKDTLDAIPFSDELLLKQKIKKLHDTDIYWLCHDIAKIKKSGVERHAGKTLYVFLHQQLKPQKEKKRRRESLPRGYR